MKSTNHQLIDLHQDLLLHIARPELFQTVTQTSFEHLERANTKIVFSSAFPVPSNFDFFSPEINDLITEDFKMYHTYLRDHPNWNIIQHTQDIDEILAHPDKRGLILHIEGLNLFTKQDWHYLDEWYDLDWRSLGPVWTKPNTLGGGNECSDLGLTKLGHDVLAWVNSRGLIVDLAHMNKQTFWDTVAILDKPLLATHTGAAGIFSHPRNLDDDQLQAIAKSNGLVGIYFVDEFLTENRLEAGISHVVNHITYLKNKIGIDHVAIGTDFGGLPDRVMPELSCLDDMPALWQALEVAGYTQREIEKISYRNALRVIKDNLTCPHSDRC